ncbi:MAG: DUF4352 domain-containing protein [Microthrixaceae bacterium]|nr:DUF4352 domain-containing protein [Microthrixaceae bacterium]
MKKLRPLIALLALTFAVGTLAASGETEEAKKVDEETGESSAAATDEEFAVGDAVALGDWQVKVYEFVDPVEVTNEFSQPEEGKRRVKVDAEVTNNGDEPANVSSLLCFELKDGENRTYDQTLFGDSDVGSIDGEIAPGEALRGEVEYDVPAEAGGFVLNFKCDLFSSGTAKITLS